MHVKIYQKILNCYGRQIHTNVSRVLSNQYYDAAHKRRMRSSRLYWSGLGILVIGFTYASVPLYRVFCQVIIYVFQYFLHLNLYMRINLFNSRTIMVGQYQSIMIVIKCSL